MARILLCLLAIAVSDAMADDFTTLDTLARQIRDGTIDVGNEYSMDVSKGRFHRLHVNTLGLACASCHYGKQYQDDFLLVRKHESPRGWPPGQISRQTCIACHQVDGIATTFYVGRVGKK